MKSRFVGKASHQVDRSVAGDQFSSGGGRKMARKRLSDLFKVLSFLGISLTYASLIMAVTTLSIVLILKKRMR